MKKVILNSRQENETLFNDQSNVNYDVGNGIIYNTEVLKFNLCDYNDVYILVKGDIVTTTHNTPTPVAFKNCAHSLNVSQKLMEQQLTMLKI